MNTVPSTVPDFSLSPVAAPLLEADPYSIDELCSRDPKTLSDAELDKIILNLRAQAVRLAKARAEGKTRAPAATTKSPSKSKIDLGDAEL